MSVCTWQSRWQLEQVILCLLVVCLNCCGVIKQYADFLLLLLLSTNSCYIVTMQHDRSTLLTHRINFREFYYSAILYRIIYNFANFIFANFKKSRKEQKLLASKVSGYTVVKYCSVQLFLGSWMIESLPKNSVLILKLC